MVATNSTGMENVMADGVMGLSNNHTSKNIFDLGYERGILVSSVFAFKLGISELHQPSYFYYNLTDQEFPQAEYTNIERHDIWSIPLEGVYINNQNFPVAEVLIDSGASFSHLPLKQYTQIYKLYFSKLCNFTNSINVCNCNVELYPNITFTIRNSFGIAFTPEMYIFGAKYSSTCYLGITPIDMERAVLSQNFLQFNTVIFDKQKNRIGFLQTIKKTP
jgi:hypothetical protein